MGRGWVVWLWGICCVAGAAEPTADEMAIRKAAASYVMAWQQRDAAKLAAHWAPEAVYISPVSGEKVKGRAAIQAEFARVFQAAGKARLKVEIDSVRFLTPEVAIEDGTAQVIAEEGEPERSSYTAVHVKKEGKWLLDSVRETVLPPPPSSYEQLQGLEWLIGEWADESDHATIHAVCRWSANKAFLTRTFTVIVGDEVNSQGVQIIGWDAAKKQIRSWAFDSDGGLAEGEWKQNGDRWVIHSKNTLPDGRTGSSINTIKPIDEDSFTLQASARQLAGEMQPNLDEIVIRRVVEQSLDQEEGN